MASSTAPARREREALCALFLEVGPDAPTLCGDWTTRDLAAHLVVRERRPDAAIGIVVAKAGGHLAKVQAEVATGDWESLVETVRSGPPAWSPTRIGAVDKAANTVEFFVHHEDVRRAGAGWEPRPPDADLTTALASMVPRFAKRLVRSSTVGIVLEPTDGGAAIVAKSAEPTVSVRGPLTELTLFAYGRQLHTRVELAGDTDAIDAVRYASFGF
jgi:uncharacterized protein (TIGR03085 family)